MNAKQLVDAIVFFSFALVVGQCELSIALTTDIVGIQMTIPPNGAGVAVGYPIPIKARYINAGTSMVSSAVFIAVVNDYQGVRYRDTVVVSNWSPGNIQDVPFREFSTSLYGALKLVVIAQVAADEDPSNDTLRSTWFSGFESDIKASAIIGPSSQSSKLQKVAFKPVVKFDMNSIRDYYDVPVRIQIRRCTNNVLVFQADTIMTLIGWDGAVDQKFPMRQGKYDIRKLDPGCYNVAGIARYGTDGDRTNDTTFSTFTVVANKVANDIALDTIFSPYSNQHVPLGTTLPITLRLRNNGTSDQSSVKIQFKWTDRKGAVIYQDSVTANGVVASEARIITLKNFIPPSLGIYTATAIATIPNEQYEYDDTLVSKLFVGPDKDVQIVAITSPVNGSTILTENPIKLAGQFRSLGNTDVPQVTVYYDLSECSGKPVYSRLYGSLHAGLTLDFPNRVDTIVSLSLKPGCYRLKMYTALSGDSNRTNDTAFSEFSVRYDQDLALDSIVAPLVNSNVASLTTSVRVRVANHGLNAAKSFIVYARVVKSDSTVYFDSISASGLQGGLTQDFSLKNFVAASSGFYDVYASVSHGSGGDSGNDWLRSSFYMGVAGPDAAPIESSRPSMNEVRPPLRGFTIRGKFRRGPGIGQTSVPVRAVVRDCITNEVRFEADTTTRDFSIEGSELQTIFPAIQGTYATYLLDIGCYNLYLIANLEEDIDHSNDTLVVPFTIGDVASVSTVRATGFALLQNTPNPFTGETTITYELPYSGEVSTRVLDAVGRTIINTLSAIEQPGPHSRMINLEGYASGVYILEICLKSSQYGVQTARMKVVLGR